MAVLTVMTEEEKRQLINQAVERTLAELHQSKGVRGGRCHYQYILDGFREEFRSFDEKHQVHSGLIRDAMVQLLKAVFKANTAYDLPNGKCKEISGFVEDVLQAMHYWRSNYEASRND